ncbi:glycosyltransferase family 2 protein [Microbulbifer aggregans]|uniref:glycosyltransferase family 2 protein n=1 Tax=Microbulbifer aggregans TaxID=1769779 RepID=UPI001CFDC566|nr:glycosyltransferase family A protein [Microbulbifer aggregans]
MRSKDYLLISPCRDEAEYMEQTLESVVNQSIRPKLWVVVDDGSKDESARILSEYESKYDFIRVITRTDRGFRAVGPGVIDAFYEGYKSIRAEDYEYLCKLDLDLVLPPTYFESLIAEMEKNPRLGSCSGKPYNLRDGKLIDERRGDELSVGMTKFYRISCFQQIGGFLRVVMWDAIDCHKSRQLGWQVASWDKPELRFIHLRVMGSSHKGVITGRMRHGFGQYYMGTDPVYMAASSLFRAVEYPLIIGGIAMYWGYLRSFFTNRDRLEDVALRQFIRRFQWRSLLQGKRKATKHMEKIGGKLWNPERVVESMPLVGTGIAHG